MRVIRARTFLLGRELPGYLTVEMPNIFDAMPNASLWLVSVDDLLLRRLMFLRAQLALTLTPDIPLVAGQFPGFQLLAAHGLTQGGMDFSSAVSLPLVMFSPDVIGIPLRWEPHTLLLLFGEAADLRKPDFAAPSQALQPHTLTRPEGWEGPPFCDRLSSGEMESLIPWWVDRLNVLYSYAVDPTSSRTRLADTM